MKTPHGFFFNMLCFLGCGEREMLHILELLEGAFSLRF